METFENDPLSEVEVSIRFKGEEESNYVYVLTKYFLDLNIDNVKKKIKLELSEAMRRNELYEVCVMDYDDDDSEPVERVLVLDCSSIVFFKL